MMVTGNRLTLPSVEGDIEAYVARPKDPRPRPGVLLYMDAIGLRPQIEQMADRIAGWGHVVLAPNVFYRHGSAVDIAPKTDLRLPGAREEFFPTVTPLVASHTADEAARDFETYLATLTGDEQVTTGAIGVTGYCMGGRLALRAAAQQPDRVAAIGMFHTGGLVTDASDSPHTRIPDVAAEVLAGYADNDKSMTIANIATVNSLLDACGVVHTSTVYSEAPHGYTMADTSMYHQPAAEWHFRQLRSLFRRHLT